MPGLRLIRPADAKETSAAWQIAVDSDGPTALVLSRQELPVLAETTAVTADGVGRGAYVLVPGGKGGSAPDLVLIGTGSEVQHCLGAAGLLESDGIAVRVVSFPSWDLFAAQDAEVYRDGVLPAGVPRLSPSRPPRPSAGNATPTRRSAIDRFGASAPGAVNMEKFGFTADNVAERARELLGTSSQDGRRHMTKTARALRRSEARAPGSTT